MKITAAEPMDQTNGPTSSLQGGVVTADEVDFVSEERQKIGHPDKIVPLTNGNTGTYCNDKPSKALNGVSHKSTKVAAAENNVVTDVVKQTNGLTSQFETVVMTDEDDAEVSGDFEIEVEVGEAKRLQQNTGHLAKLITVTNGKEGTYRNDKPGKSVVTPKTDLILTNGDSNQSSPKKLQDKTDDVIRSPSLNGICAVRTEEDGRRTNGDVASCQNGDVPCCNGVVINGSDINGLDDHLAADWDRTVAGVKEQAFARLQEELSKAHQELKLRDEEVNRLSRIREEVEGELEELTASLFQEAHNMVREANVRQATAERSLKESQMQVEVLTAEVAALKTLVLTSTPSRPNPHLHPQIDLRGNRPRDDSSIPGVSLFNRKHRRSPSHYNLKYGRENSPPESPVKEQRPPVPEPLSNKEGCEVDPNVHKEFVAWKEKPCMDKSDTFIARLYREDINLCLDFNNKELGARVQEAVEKGNLFIEAVSDKSKTVFPKKCALLEAPRQCHYRMRMGDQEQWHCISQICRNRIIAVCDFLNYLRYIERGLVKSSVHDVYWEMTRLRKEMAIARLGLAISS